MICIKQYILTVLFITVGFTYSCQISPDCETTDTMEHFRQLEGETNVIFYDSIALPPHTLNEAVEPGEEYRFDDSTAYESISMTDFELPDIDHENYTLIGKYMQAPCLAIFKRKWIKEDKHNYRYLIKVVQDNRCVTASCLNFSYNLIAVPKLPPNAKVKIEVGRQETDCEC